jgi:predicted nucleotidyltransferase
MMRLTDEQVRTAKSTIDRVLGVPHKVWLFGSRADDELRGGDIDLMIETDEVFPNRARVLCQLHGALTMALGERKLDIVLKDGRTDESPIFQIARRTGLPL